MNLQFATQVPAIISSSILSVAVIAVPIPVNPPKIVAMGKDEFTIDLHEMKRWVPCVVEFHESKYMIWKNDDDALVMIDAEMLGSKSNDK